LSVRSNKAQVRGNRQAELEGTGYLKLKEGLWFTWIPETEAGNAFS